MYKTLAYTLVNDNI